MPLSDHEQRLLEQMERALYAEDPKFADALRKNRRPNIDRGRVVLGSVGILIGLAVLVAGVATSIAVLGVVGFVAMLFGAFVIYRAVNRPAGEDAAAPAAGAPAAKGPSARAGSGNGFMDRMEERWRRRREGRDQF